MWSKPWSYKEGLIIGAGLLVIGALLQITVGGINWNLFAWPVIYLIFVWVVEPLFRSRVISIYHCSDSFLLNHIGIALTTLGNADRPEWETRNGGLPIWTSLTELVEPN